MRKCKIDGCGRDHLALGMCRSHYERARYQPKPSDRGPIEDRFWKKVAVAGPDECWNWTGHIASQTGYGRIWGGAAVGAVLAAHRVSFELNKGPIPHGRLVMHSCDNRACVNPAHLSLGTDQENCNDKVCKGRHSHGSRHYGAILTEEKVRYMRAHPEITNAEFERRYGVGSGVISNARRGITWRHVD